MNLSDFALPGATTISDVRLAAKVHSHPDHNTFITSHIYKGNKYELYLCGSIKADFDALNALIANIRCGQELSETDILKLESPARPLDVELLESPWFEWTDESGTAVGDVFDEISINLNKERTALEDLLST